MELQLTTCKVGGRTVVAVAGEVDLDTGRKLLEHLVHLIDDGHHRLVVDLGGVEFMDSSGLVVLLDVRRRVCAHDGSLRLVCTREPILKIFRITGFDQVFPIYDAVFAAVLAGDEAQAVVNTANARALELDPGTEQDVGVV